MMKTKRTSRWGLLLAAVLLAVGHFGAAPVEAQILYGTVVGNVTDPSGASIPGATVAVTNRQTNWTRQVSTGPAGGFTVSTVPGGTYELRVTLEGFRTYVQSGLNVATNTVTRTDVVMQLGQVSEQIEVSAQALTLQTDRAEVRSEVTRVTLENVPVPPGRNYQHLFVTLPGFSQPRSSHSIPSNPSRALQFEVNGTVSASNNVRLDGATQFNVWLPHVTAYVPALESIEAVNVVTGSFDAEQGLAGGAAINVQIKSGTNEVHGSAFHYHNNNQTKAKPFFLPQGERNPRATFNQFGGTVGGPIKKDRIFYFGSYEGTNDRQFAGGLYTVPTVLSRQGIMTESNLPVYDPMTGDINGRGRTPFPNQTLPAARMSRPSLLLNELLPMPTVPAAPQGNLFAQGIYGFDRHTIDAKTNFNITDKLTSYVRYSFLDYTANMPTSHGDLGGSVIRGGNPGQGFGKTHSLTAAMTYTFSPNFIIDSNFGYTLMDTNVEQPRLEENLGLDFLGLPGTNGSRRFEGGWPGFGISNHTAFGMAQNYMPYFRSDPQWQWIVNGNLTKGAHNLRFGMELGWQHLNHVQPEFYGGAGPASGRFNFAGGPTGLNGGPAPNQWNAYSTFLLGLPTQVAKLYQWPDQYNTRTSMQSLYFRDQWQVNRRLTLNIGTRWNYFPMPTRSDRGLERYFFPGAGGELDNQVMVCGVGVAPRDCGVAQSKRLFAPSIGLAYRMSDTTVLRMGYGLNTDPWNIARAMRTNHPLLTAQTENAVNTWQPVSRFEQGIPVLTEPSVGNGIIPIPRNVVTNTLDDEFRRGYVQSWNVTLQKQFRGGWVAQAGYVGTRQTGFLGYEERNFGFPGGGAASRVYFPFTQRNVSTAVVNRIGNSTYDSLQTTLERRFANGFQMNVMYTFSKCIGIAGFGNSGDRASIKIPEAFHLNRSQCGQHQPHNYSTTGIWELPFGKGKNWATSGVGAALLGGWQMNGMLNMYSGSPFTVGSSGASLNAPENGQRAHWVGGNAKPRKLGGAGRGQAFYDWTQFAPVTTPEFGSLGFNTLLGPGLINLDMGLFRNFQITERVRMTFRAEAFNATNTPHFGNPSNNISNLRLNPNGTFGSGVFEITGVRNTGREGIDERVFRFGLRFQF